MNSNTVAIIHVALCIRKEYIKSAIEKCIEADCQDTLQYWNVQNKALQDAIADFNQWDRARRLRAIRKERKEQE